MHPDQSAVIYRQTSRDVPLIGGGNDCYLYDTDGKRYLDFASSACTASLGHSNKRVLAEMQAQMKNAPNIFSGIFGSPIAEMAGRSIEAAFNDEKPGWFSRVIFQQGGGEAVDLALRLAYQYQCEAGKSDRDMIGTRSHSFHGVLTLNRAISGYYPRYKLTERFAMGLFEDQVIDLDHPLTSPGWEASISIIARDWDTIGAIIVEPQGGPATGCYVDNSADLRVLRDICDAHDIILIFDEVLCGAGRCGYMSVAAHHDVWPDICILGKGISSGYQPVSAICMSQKVAARLRGGSGSLEFGTTYSAHPIGCAAVYGALEYMREKALFQRVRTQALGLSGLIEAELLPIDGVSAIRGMGYLIGVEIAPKYGNYFNPDLEVHKRIREAAFREGLLIYSKGGTIEGAGDFLTIAPPFEIERAEIEEALPILKRVIHEVTESL